jgi:hypothetical protein
VPELTDEVRQATRARRLTRLHLSRRSLTGLAVAGMTGVVVLTGAVSGAAASPATHGPSRVITLTNSTSSSAGHLTIQLKYELVSARAIKMISIKYSGGSPLKLARPALVVTLRPVIGLPLPRAGKPPRQGPVVTLVLRIRDLRSFSGNLPTRFLVPVGKGVSMGVTPPKREIVPAGAVLEASVASVSAHRPINFSAPVGLQVGLLFGPAGL